MKSILSIISVLFLMVGCGSKKYFEPKETFNPSKATSSYNGKIVDMTRDGASLSNGFYIGKNGVVNIKLGEGYRFLNENSNYVLTTNRDGILKIIDKKTKTTLRKVDLQTPVVSASIKKGVVAYILNDNSFGLYRVKTNKKIMQNRSQQSFAVDTRASSPMFVDNLVVMPMLDGKLIIMDLRNTNNAKVIYISSASAFNNIIFLSRIGNTMISATANKIITIGNAGENEYSAHISEVALGSGKIYLFTKEGDVIVLNQQLKKLNSHKYKFAHFATAKVIGDKIYALDQQGSLIVTNSKLTYNRIYELDKITEPVIIRGNKLYKDGKIINLSKLSYE